MSLNLAERLTMGIIRGILNAKVSGFTEQTLQEAIHNNTNLWGNTPENLRNQIQGLKNKFETHFNKYIENITTELLLEWLKKDQKHLYQVIQSTPENHAWFDRQVQTYINHIKNI